MGIRSCAHARACVSVYVCGCVCTSVHVCISLRFILRSRISGFHGRSVTFEEPPHPFLVLVSFSTSVSLAESGIIWGEGASVERMLSKIGL